MDQQAKLSPSYYDDIIEFHRKFDLLPQSPPTLLGPELYEFRRGFLHEELREFEEAHANGNLVKAFDALIDLVYVALGTACMMNLPFNDGWALVHAANMTKVRTRRVDDSKRGSTYDVVKPADWVSPEPLLHRLLLISVAKWGAQFNPIEEDANEPPQAA